MAKCLWTLFGLLVGFLVYSNKFLILHLRTVSYWIFFIASGFGYKFTKYSVIMTHKILTPNKVEQPVFKNISRNTCYRYFTWQGVLNLRMVVSQVDSKKWPSTMVLFHVGWLLIHINRCGYLTRCHWDIQSNRTVLSVKVGDYRNGRRSVNWLCENYY